MPPRRAYKKKTSNSKVICPCCEKSVTRGTRINHLKKKKGAPIIQVVADAYRAHVHENVPQSSSSNPAPILPVLDERIGDPQLVHDDPDSDIVMREAGEQGREGDGEDDSINFDGDHV